MRDLGTLGGYATFRFGINDSGQFGINDSGQVVGYSDTDGGQRHAFVW